MGRLYDVGDLVRVHALFTNSDDDPIDPSSVNLAVRDPTGETITYAYPDPAIIKDIVGYYHSDINVAMAGRYHFRWYSTGTGQAAGEDYFVVKESLVI